MPDLPGSLGRYTVLGELDRGGIGRVLRAVDPEIGREVAIKVLLDTRGADRAALERFVAEARITGQLEHPNIVPVYDAGIADDGGVFYVMKKVEGQNLDTVLRVGGLSLHRLLGAFLHVCSAVSFAHHRGVLHQDLKPQNIMIGDFGEVLVLDWGLATLLRAGLLVTTAAPGGIVGTAGFIAPERIARPAEPPTALADQWSLGGVLYTLLCRRAPYEAGTSRAVLEATLRGPPVDVRLRDPDVEVPHEVAEICMRALAQDPADRFPDVAALGAAILAFQEGSERRLRALAEVAEADRLAPRIAETRARAAALVTQARERLGTVKASAPVEDKREAWLLEDAAAAALREADLDEVVWEQHLQGALRLVPDLHEAHVRLARHHRERLEAAEARRDPGGAARAEWLLRQHDRGHHRRWLLGTGSLTLRTEPAGASVRLFRYAQHDRRLVPVEERALGETPLVDVPLAPGSYLLVLDAPGRATVRYPVFLSRAGRWDGVPPGDTDPSLVYLPWVDELGPDDVYVPAGWFLAGGDPDAPDALSARRVWVDGFVCRRFPVTNGEYASFLDAQTEEGAARLVPRDVPLPAHPLDGAPTFARGRDGRFGPAPGAVGPGEDPERWAQCPVTRIDLHGALQFATAGGWRLLDELEREKAARGVDGRHYPWGDRHDPAFSCVLASRAPPQPVPVSTFPFDESVYGVRGLGGNVRDFCGNRWTRQGPAGDGERLVLHAADPSVDYVGVRGGAWSSVANLARSATRFGDAPSARQPTRGLRLARRIG
jgi:formylglycine-generating enzyme required for sulfatase activity